MAEWDSGGNGMTARQDANTPGEVAQQRQEALRSGSASAPYSNDWSTAPKGASILLGGSAARRRPDSTYSLDAAARQHIARLQTPGTTAAHALQNSTKMKLLERETKERLLELTKPNQTLGNHSSSCNKQNIQLNPSVCVQICSNLRQIFIL